MSRRLLRAVCTAALAAALVVSPATAAPAEPNPVPPGDTGETLGDAAEVDAETALAAPEAPEALGAPKSVATLLRELQTLYQEAEEASETYNATAEKLKQRTAEAKKVGAELAKARAALELSRGDAGRLAREQYQGRTEFSAYLQLLLARDPLRALDQSHVIERVAAGRAATLVLDSAPTPRPDPRADTHTHNRAHQKA
ncbi:coiled-coil domain-containing protein, partial [Streptomyces bacillaris]